MGSFESPQKVVQEEYPLCYPKLLVGPSRGSEGSRMALASEDGIPAVNPAGLSPVEPTGSRDPEIPGSNPISGTVSTKSAHKGSICLICCKWFNKSGTDR